MSRTTWRKAFMPTPATGPKTWKAALAHSLRKWRGLTWANLAKHGLTPETVAEMDADNCALCQRASKANDSNGYLVPGEDCEGCPLYGSRNKVKCWKETWGELNRRDVAPYHAWTYHGDARPMIDALEAAQAWLKAQGRTDV